MHHSLEAYFLANFAADVALLAVVARANECMRLRRVLLSGILAAFYALMTEVVSSRLEHPAIQIVLLIILSMLLIGEPDARKWSSIAIQLAGGAMILGGIGGIVPSSGRFTAAAFGAGLLLVMTILNVRARRIFTWDVTVLISAQGHNTSFRALIDTGNRLHEPVSGLPVLIAESRLLDALPVNELSCRRISFGVLGGGGTMQCFRPDSVLIQRGKTVVRAPDVWVAVYPDRIPGPAGALAPPSFAIIPGGYDGISNPLMKF